MDKADSASSDDKVSQVTTTPAAPDESEKRVRKSVSLVADLRGPLVCVFPKQGIEPEPEELHIVECLENISTRKNKTVYQGLHWPDQPTDPESSKHPRADECSVCLCSQLRIAAEVRAFQALQGCPNLMPVLGVVNFSRKSAAMQQSQRRKKNLHDDDRRTRQPYVPHLQGYCTPRPHSNLDTYMYGRHAFGSAGQETSSRIYNYSQHSTHQLTGIARQVLRCLLGIQQRGLVHTDCHTSPEVCVGDFSYCVPSGAYIGAELHSSLAHTPPEVFSGAQRTADGPQMAWAFGVMLWQLFSGLPPACMMYKEGYQACIDMVCGGLQCNGSASCQSGLSCIKSRCSFLGKVLRAPQRDDRIDWVLRGLLRADPASRMSLAAASDIIGTLWKDMQSCSYPTAMQVVAMAPEQSLKSNSWLSTDLTAFTFTPPDWRTAMNLAARHCRSCALLGEGFSRGTIHEIASLQREKWMLGDSFPLPKEPVKRSPLSSLKFRSSLRKQSQLRVNRAQA